MAKGDVSQSRLDDARATAKSAAAALDQARAKLEQALETLGQKGEDNPAVRQALAAVDEAKLNLEHTEVRAPCSGRISGFMLKPGEVLQKDEKQGVLVCDGRFWVYANYKETELSRLRPGQVATLSIGMYPNRAFHGIIESVDAASGAAFSLLPPENAAGNWVKVTQRVPVRILIVDAGPRYPLLVQTSVSVSVDTGSRQKPLGLERGTTLDDEHALALAGKAGLTGDGQKYLGSE